MGSLAAAEAAARQLIYPLFADLSAPNFGSDWLTNQFFH
jgi:hypothetical protein